MSNKLTERLGAKVGSSFIDANFKRWLRGAIGDEIYGCLDPNMGGEQVTNTMEGALVRQFVKSFDEYKKTFSNSSPDVQFELPLINPAPKSKPKPMNMRGRAEPLPQPRPEPIHVPGRVDKGLLTITKCEPSIRAIGSR